MNDMLKLNEWYEWYEAYRYRRIDNDNIRKQYRRSIKLPTSSLDIFLLLACSKDYF